MPDRDWRGNAAGLTLCAIVALTAAYVAWGWGLTSGQRAEADRTAYQRARYAEEYIDRACVGMDRAALIECIQDAINSSREDQRAEYDLNAQEEMARWAWWLLMTSVLTVFTAGIGIYYVQASLVEARTATMVNREIGEAQARAYLAIKQCGAWLIENDGIAMFVNIENLGNTPARDVHFVCEVFCNVPASDVFSPDDGQDWFEQRTFFTRPWTIGDVTAHSTEMSGQINFSELDIPAGIARDESGRIRVAIGQIGVFAADVFDVELYESGDLVIFGTEMEYVNFTAVGGRVPAGASFHSDAALRKKGWGGHFKRGKPRRRLN